MLRRIPALFIFCLLIVGIFSTCAKRKEYKIETIETLPSLKRFGKDYSQEIQISKQFAERFISAYRNLLDREVHSAFHSSFLFSEAKPIAVRTMFSQMEGAFIYIFPGESQIMAEGTKYPIQMTLFSGLEDIRDAVLVIPEEQALKQYYSLPVMFDLLDSITVLKLSDMKLNTPNLRIFRIAKASVVMLSNVKVKFRTGGARNAEITFDHIGILTDQKDFSSCLGAADFAGEMQAQSEIVSLFVESEFFRESLANEKLRSKAEVIQKNLSRSQKDPSFEYPYWQFKMDVDQLKAEAKEAGVDVSYVDDLLKDLSTKLHDGVLLWYYSNHLEFMIQWLGINVTLVIFLAVIRFAFKRKVLFKQLPNIINRFSLPSIIVAINGWVLLKSPSSLGVYYYLLPGLFFFLGLILIALFFEGANKKASPSTSEE